MSTVKVKARRNSLVEWKRLQARLDELEATMIAIRRGDVDAIVVDGPQGSRIFSLRSPEDPYRVLAERMSEGAATLTSDGTIVFCNQRLAEMTGVSGEQLLGSSLAGMLREPGGSNLPALLAQALLRNVRTDADLLRGDGSTLPVQLSLSSIPLEGSEHGICLVATDLSERKRAEERLKTSSLYSRSLLEASLDPLVTISRQGKITDVNQATVDVTGVAREGLIGSDFCDYFTEPEKAREGYERAFSESRVQDYPLAIRHSSGQVKDVLYNAAIFWNEEGEVGGVFAAARDITARKQAEERLQRVNNTLRVLNDCTEALMKATDESAMLQLVCDTVVHAGGHRMAWVGCAEHDRGKTVRPVAQAGFEEGYLETANISWADTERGRGPTGTAVRSGKVTVCHDVISDARFAPWRANAIRRGYGSVIVLPLKSDGQTFGALTIYAAEKEAFDAREQRLLEELANNMIYAIMALRAGSQRRQAEAAVAAEREKFNSILDVLPPYVVLLTPDYHATFANREFRKRFGESGGRRCFEFLFNRSEPCEICETHSSPWFKWLIFGKAGGAAGYAILRRS